MDSSKSQGNIMLNGKRIAVVMPAYNAEKTLEMTYREIPQELVDIVILVDDQSRDDTVKVAQTLGIDTIVHPKNRGYGGNQKTCYRSALDKGADVVVMLHPDYQYTPRLITSIASMVAFGEYDVALGSRVLLGGALRGGMPVYKYISNRFLTWAQNWMIGGYFSEYHTGYRAFSKEVLLSLPLEENSDNFVFDNQFLAQAIFFGYRIGEISCPTKYFEEASSISFMPSVRYGIGVLRTSMQFMLQKRGLAKYPIFDAEGRKLPVTEETRKSNELKAVPVTG
jgi:glycosyltransferase involved in cell wall biosynthesis